MVMRAPHRVPADGMPDRVTIYEVGPRDGLQNEKLPLTTEVKAEFIHRLTHAGLKIVEVAGFVHPGWVPQLADAEKLLGSMERVEGVRYPVLVPNLRGLQRAKALGMEDVAVFLSATETFSKRNLNRTIAESLEMTAPVVADALAAGMRVRAYVSMAFGDPWEGVVPIEQTAEVAARVMGMGCTELSLGDTIGVGTPGHVVALTRAAAAAGIPLGQIDYHFHDTYGQALANVYAALQCGITTIDSSAGGLGGCPFAESASGNLATEDLVWMLDGLGIDHGVDLEALVEASSWMARQLGRPSPSRTVQALARVTEGVQSA